ncbi:hypothetical protein RJ639_022256 [Escallonia herrerae]|uniref:Uncharacterized protein n=1 Tax=Escallonia herrerae TaxID=1293975 RepID=A0AA88V691_9ASTE|nr:hypothetical protein RJ639_022256 [Escallonia herrerae]
MLFASQPKIARDRGEIKGLSGGGRWGPQRLPASLAWLSIIGGGGAEWWYNSLELPENNSLAELSITFSKNVECIPRGLLQSLTSLERLYIRDCPKFRSLPRGLLPMLSSLVIEGCPLLERSSYEDYFTKHTGMPP